MTQQPAIGEVISARYKGTCTRTGKAYQPGARIARDEFGYHLADAPNPGGEIRLGGGSGYGCDGWFIGDVVWHDRTDQVVVITRASSRYHREDGLSFGVGDDRGYVHSALARPATPEEAAPVLAAREARRQAQEKTERLQAGLRTLFNWRAAGGRRRARRSAQSRRVSGSPYRPGGA